MADIAVAQDLLHTVRPEVVYHLAGMSTASPELERVLPTFHSLLTSTLNTLMAATDVGCRRIILTASLTEPLFSQHEATPSSPYAAAKWAGGAYARMFRALYGTPVVIVRPFMTYGPKQNENKVIPYVISSLSRGTAPQLTSGDWQVDWIYVDDVIDGFLAAAQASDVEGCTIDLGSGVLVSMREVVRKLVKLVDNGVEPRFGAVPDRPLEQVRVADTANAYAKLGWKPLTALEDGLQRTIAWNDSRHDESRDYAFRAE